MECSVPMATQSNGGAQEQSAAATAKTSAMTEAISIHNLNQSPGVSRHATKSEHDKKERERAREQNNESTLNGDTKAALTATNNMADVEGAPTSIRWKTLKAKMTVEAEDNANYLTYLKIESLLRRMFDANGGVPLRSVKSFITKLPSVFTGSDLVSWTQRNLNIADPSEALHLLNAIASYGYIFPVEERQLTIKNDANVYYRFQTPFFWPSRSETPENIDYAVYLCKRALQNRSRYELADYEAENLARLQKLLSRKWEFVYTQAEMHAKIDRKRDKFDREILDSQERAYWDLHRPPPTSLSMVELDLRKACRRYKPSRKVGQGANLLPTSVSEQQMRRDIESRIMRLIKLQERRRVKVSKCAEHLVAFCQQNADYDLLISSDQPNPWVTESTEFWDEENSTTEISAKRARKWCFSLLDLFNDPLGRAMFEKFLEREFSKENLKFWEACAKLKFLPQRELRERTTAIYVQYLAPGAVDAVNVDSKIAEALRQKLQHMYSDRYIFEEAKEHIYMLMSRDSYSRFLRSEQYKELLSTQRRKVTMHHFNIIDNISNLLRKDTLAGPPPSPTPAGHNDTQTTTEH